MADSHVRILRAFARHHQREVEGPEVVDPDHGSQDRRHDLERTAARSRAQLAAAEARRRRPIDA
jgi:hypothetical protein